jgi:zinc protease
MMSRRHVLPPAIVALAVVLATLAAVTWSPLARGDAPASAGVVRATLANGLRVVIVPDPLVPVVSTQMNYLVGAQETPDGFPGTAHAEEHMMFRGSPGLSGDQLTLIGAELGGSFNAMTQQTVTRYLFTVPAADLDVALSVEAIRMRGVLNDEQGWALERGAIQQEVSRNLSSPEYLLYARLLDTVFKGTPYAHDALGTLPSFDKTTAAMLRRFHDAWYGPNNAILVVAGSVESGKVLARVRDLFGDIPARPTPPRPVIQFQPVSPETIRRPTDRSTGTVTIAFRLPGSNSPDFAATVIMTDALESDRGPLNDLVVAGKALSAGFSVHPLPEASLGMASASFARGADAQALLTEVTRIVNEARTQGIAPDLVEAAKRHEVTEAEFRKNSVSGLASAWSHALAVAGRQSPDDDIDAVKRVTAADVNRIARRELDPGHAVVAILEPQSSGGPAPVARAGGEESFARPPTAAVMLPDWAERALERLSVPAPTVRATDKTLPNGLRLIVVPESVSDTVSVSGRIRSDAALEAPPGREGVDQVLDRLFAFGTTSLDRVSFQRALDDIGAVESAGTDFHVRALARDLDRAVELLADNELHPALPEAAFTIVKRQIAETVAGQRQSPGYLARLALRAGLYPKGDPALREPSPESLSALTLEDIKAYFQRVFRPELTTIVVVGNVSADAAEAVIAKHFGGWKASGPTPETVLPPVPLNRPASTAVPNSTRRQDSVILAQTIDVTRTSPDYHTLELGNTVLGGGLSGRLYRQLRSTTGLVYQVSSFIQAREKRAVFLVQYGCDPANVARAREMIQRELVAMQQLPVTEWELRRAKGLLLRGIPLAEQSVRSIMQGLLYRATLGLPLDEPIIAAHRYLALTADDVKRAFAAHVRPGAFVEVTEGPASP